MKFCFVFFCECAGATIEPSKKNMNKPSRNKSLTSSYLHFHYLKNNFLLFDFSNIIITYFASITAFHGYLLGCTVKYDSIQFMCCYKVSNEHVPHCKTTS